MNVFSKLTKRLLSLLLTVSMLLGLIVVGISADEPEPADPGASPKVQLTRMKYYELDDAPDITFSPDITYRPTVTRAERDRIHAAVEALSGYVGDMVAGDGTYDPLTLVGGLADGSSYDSLSRGRGGEAVPTAYPFQVADNENNQFEHTRKVAKLAWVVQLAKDLGFPVVVQRQDDKYVYVEIGDPDAPEMVMALSHLDSSTSAATPAQLARWVDAEGNFDPEAYHKPYVKDGWLYGTGVQDDSGPTLATLFAAKALMDAGVKFDRRIRIVMGIYEDGGPGTPSVADTLKFMNIPYYTETPGFYDNWAYKYLNREETPIAGYTSDSRFPVVVGNGNAINTTLTINLSSDTGKAFRLLSAEAGVTLREGDPTLKDIVYGSASQIASRAVFKLDIADAEAGAADAFISSVTTNATARGWLPTEAGSTPKVQITAEGDCLVLEINTDVAMEYPTPQYSKNAVVWGMYLISKALDEQGVSAEDLLLKKAADGITDLFFRYTLEGEAYIGRYMGIPEELLRNPNNGVANLTFALMGGINNENLTSFYNANTGLMRIPMQTRSMHTNQEDYDTAIGAVTQAWTEKGFEIAAFAAFSDPTLYLSHDNPLTALQMASYKSTIEHDPTEFTGAYDLLDISYPVGTTGGTLATNFRNKMTAFGAVIPGNERWWHTANERISVESIIQMTKMMADGMLEMARYTEAAGAQYMWADIDGLNADRADLDLLDVTIGTYQDASSAVASEYLAGDVLLGATSFDIPMWAVRGNSNRSAPLTTSAYEAGHESGGVYLPLDDPNFTANTFVLPMRLEFKVEKPGDMYTSDWNALVDGGFEGFSFNVLTDGDVIPLVLPEGADAEKYFSTRVPSNDPNSVYVSVNLAITDAPYTGVETILADSKTDLYSLNPEYLASNSNPFPERGAIEERGFFLFGDGEKNARFTSPDAIYITTEAYPILSSGGGGGSSRYSVTVESTSHGTVKADKASASSGSKVTLTVTPDKGYVLSSLIVEDSKGKEIKVTEASGKYTFSMPASKVTVSARFRAEDSPIPFSDVDVDAWYYDAVVYAYEKGLFSGTSASAFSPDSAMTRAMLVTVLYSMEGSPDVSGSVVFTDVTSGSWYHDAVLWAIQKGIVSGYSNTLFGSNDIVTREQMAAILYGYAKYKNYGVNGSSPLTAFNDAGQVSDWANEALQWAVGNRLLSGKGNGILDPKGGATRAEVAQILMRFAQETAA